VGFLTGEFFVNEHGIGWVKPSEFVPVAIPIPPYPLLKTYDM
jgi:hypothetical protein